MKTFNPPPFYTFRAFRKALNDVYIVIAKRLISLLVFVFLFWCVYMRVVCVP